MYARIILTLLSALLLSVPAMSMPTREARAASATFTGKGTWFDVGLGACGFTNVNSDLIVALPASQYGTGQYCNRYVAITNTQTNKNAYALVRDECPGCPSGSLDMSPSLFQALGAPLSEGVIPITWSFEPAGFHP